METRRRDRLRKGRLDSISRMEHLVRCLRWVRSEYFSDTSACLEPISGYLFKVFRI